MCVCITALLNHQPCATCMKLNSSCVYICRAITIMGCNYSQKHNKIQVVTPFHRAHKVINSCVIHHGILLA
ncbi:hypothetical protein HanIR_Chr07g0317131 [Helianthus annuus]|nr:hypothetical protein HanIR_Chr07g0317131 [Helianthus annuus]